MNNLDLIKDSLGKASLHRLMKAINDFKKEGNHFLQRGKVHILRNHTVDNIKYFIQGFGYLSQLDISTAISGYDILMQEILDGKSAIFTSNPDVIILSLVFENLIPFHSDEFKAENVINRINELIEAISSRSSNLIICNTFLAPTHNYAGAAAWKDRDSFENIIFQLNSWLREKALKENKVYLIDWNQIEQRLGKDNSRDYRMWHMAKSLLTDAFLREYAREITNIIKALKGKSKKCLILDCDNTLWGGIIGEDGMDNIKLDPYDYPGSIYYNFQQGVLKLIDNGIIVALCSKNNEEDVFEVLDKHPSCLIKREHVSAHRINWGDKAKNINDIAQELNLGLDSFVFVDDNPLECEIARKMIPDVTVMQVPKDLSEYPFFLLKEGLFNGLAKSDEDKNRTNMYVTETKRKRERNQFDNLEDFLSSLDLVASIINVSDIQIKRAAQLTQKTNQFNMTTKRYSESDIKKIVDNDEYDVLCLSLKDRFGDYGIVGVCIIQYRKNEAEIDTFLISCRVLGRKAEDVFLSSCLDLIRKKGKKRVIGKYFATAKNSQVKDFYRKNGFDVVQENEKKSEAIYNFKTNVNPDTLSCYKEIIFV